MTSGFTPLGPTDGLTHLAVHEARSPQGGGFGHDDAVYGAARLLRVAGGHDQRPCRVLDGAEPGSHAAIARGHERSEDLAGMGLRPDGDSGQGARHHAGDRVDGAGESGQPRPATSQHEDDVANRTTDELAFADIELTITCQVVPTTESPVSNA